MRSTNLLSDVRGVSSVEYLLVACLIAVGAVGGARALGERIEASVDGATNVLAQLPTQPAPVHGASSPPPAMAAIGAHGEDGACGASGGAIGEHCDPATFASCEISRGGITVTLRCDPVLWTVTQH